jgi:hypothetical protein
VTDAPEDITRDASALAARIAALPFAAQWRR